MCAYSIIEEDRARQIYVIVFYAWFSYGKNVTERYALLHFGWEKC